MREKQRRTVSSNSRSPTVLFQQYSANLSFQQVPQIGAERHERGGRPARALAADRGGGPGHRSAHIVGQEVQVVEVASLRRPGASAVGLGLRRDLSLWWLGLYWRETLERPSKPHFECSGKTLGKQWLSSQWKSVLQQL